MTRSICALGVVLTCMIGWSVPDASAQQVRKKFKDKIRVVQPKPVLQKKRLEIAPRFGVSFNDPLYRSVKVGANLNFHISERFWVGGLFEWYDFGTALGGPTDTFAQIQSETNTAPDTPSLNWVGGLEVGFTPIFGKFALFNRQLGYYDLGVSLGGVYASSKSIQLPADQQGAGATIAAYNHIFLSEWVSLNFEIRDVIYFSTLQGQADSALSHAVCASVGFGLYFPRGFERSEPEGKPADE